MGPLIVTGLVIVLGVVLIGAITAWSTRSMLQSATSGAAAGEVTEAHDSDGRFWTAFAAVAGVFAVAGLGAAIMGRAGPVLAIFAFIAIAAGGSYLVVGSRRAAREQIAAAQAERRQQLCERHDAIVYRWLDYEMDPAKQIDYPQMTSVNEPLVAAVIRAMREAREARDTADDAEFEVAVERLEIAFDAAERNARGEL